MEIGELRQSANCRLHGKYPGTCLPIARENPNKIVVTKSSDVCGQCHTGNDSKENDAELMESGHKWIVGYKPGMDLSKIKGTRITPVDPNQPPPGPDVQDAHLRQLALWQASGHGTALGKIDNNERATAECYGCHSAEGFAAKLQGEKFDDAKSNIALRIKDGSKGAHNIEYAIKIMDKAGKDLDAVKAAVK